MQIESALLCRASGKVYNELLIRDVPEDHVVFPYLQDGNEQSVPFRLFSETSSSPHVRRYVAVFPIADVQSATYTIAESSSDGRELVLEERSINYDAAKWTSRVNYRLNAKECQRIKNYDDSHFDNHSSISVTQIIPDRDYMIVRGSYRAPYRGHHTVQLACRDSDLNLLDATYVPIGASQDSSRFSPYVTYWSHNFSVRLPRSLNDFYILGWDSSRANTNAYIQLPQHKIDALLGETERHFMSAALDPYYEEWLRGQRPTLSEQKLQSECALPLMPKFSLVVPLFKTPPNLFDEMVASVREQSYSNWELILINASPEATELNHLAAEACAEDERIKTITLDENRGISGNTSEGIAQATGDFVCFLDHDDLIEPDALFQYAQAVNKHPESDLIYCDEDVLDTDGRHHDAFFKPDFDIDLLRTKNYVAHMLAVRRSLLKTLDFNFPEYDGAQDHHLTLQSVEHARYVCHVPKVLYHWRVCETSSAGNPDNKAYANEAGMRAVAAHLKRMNLSAKVVEGKFPFTYRVLYDVPSPTPLVSIVIPTCDHVDVLRTCVESILEKTAYDNYEVVIVENNSVEESTFKYYEGLLEREPQRVRVEYWPDEFNYSKIINFGVSRARGDYLLLLNNDTELITPEWLERFVGLCSRDDVGAAGALLYYPDDTIQHAGVVVNDTAGNHLFKDMPRGNWGYFNLADCQRQLTAVTAACLMTTRKAFEAVNGFEEAYAVCYNDVDFCLKLRDRGYHIIYTPEVQMYHHESLSRGLDQSESRRIRYAGEHALVFSRWHHIYATGDPYFSPNVRQAYPLNSWYCF